MAEFLEVIRQKHRMCEDKDCHVCPLYGVEFCARYDIDPKNAEQAETIIMQWASEHPEPQYPTWEEWEKENFPLSDNMLCIGHFKKCPGNRGVAIRCKICRQQPIPAEIAEKLGVRPKEAGK